jgi:hypothetical protein
MDKYYVEVLVPVENHAGTKARDDLALFLKNISAKSIVFDREIGRVESFLFTKLNMLRKFSHTKPGDMVIVSHPIFFRKWFINYLMKIIKQKKLKSVLMLHDVDSIRGSFNAEEKSWELDLINHFDYVISHNHKMTGWLEDHSIKSKIVDLGIFDYYNPCPIVESRNCESKVIFAGNLEKANFLRDADKFRFNLELFGPNPSLVYPNNINYVGSFSPNSLPMHLNGNYGLVWDGDSSETCTGKLGEYLKYNNPHKTSLYLSCGLPVIVWKKAAIAVFIMNNKIGLCVDSLQELDEILSNMSKDEYMTLKKNAIEMAKKLRTGFFTRQALAQIEAYMHVEENENDL